MHKMVADASGVNGIGVQVPLTAEEIAEVEARKPPLSVMANFERDRRIKLGVTVTTSTGKSIPVDLRNEVDFRNLNGLGSASHIRITSGSLATFDFTDAKNVTHTLTPVEMLEVAMGALGHVSNLYGKARAIKNAAPAPADVTADALWA